ncbi:hypothetical protein C5C18_07050 [Rathayibacter tritici]|uniref:alpha/beta hydrolase n=1 Tax=Rathayibacter tritici TaxID=33888 RepID=UPI000CE75EAD|nr:alpha/beta hydrolase-fold protein [Rathayibacter tritici]PPF65894.1 hypothetical protein C5C21_10400 [Rathayibacter tritici]PPG07550.1 hypothetical protein C5C18_07050 [Rathayibacter tritici]
MTTLLDLSLVSGVLVVSVYALAATALLLLLAVHIRSRGSGRIRRGALAVAFLLLGLLIGIALAALVGESDGPFGVDFTPITRLWIGLGFGGVAVALVVLVQAIRRRRVRGVLASLGVAVLVVATAAMSINIDFGQYPTVRSALGISAYSDSDVLAVVPGGPHADLATWIAPPGMPAAGSVSSVAIPATASGFPARDAVVYLPPAALTAAPPLLPVMVMLSGQPGSPSDPLSTEKLQQALDTYATAHAGLAPIVVSPDQLGDPNTNTMCIDSPMGKSATYLTVDVPNWIRANLPVLGDAQHWAIGGLSQGGTCAIQLGAGFPALFGNIIDASGELAPTLGSEAATIAQGFGGDAAAYKAATPLGLLAKNAPYTGTVAIFGVGANDASFLPGAKTLHAAALAAGMNATYIEVPGSAHDVTAWSATFDKGLEILADRWNLVPAA